MLHHEHVWRIKSNFIGILEADLITPALSTLSVPVRCTGIGTCPRRSGT